jgi:ABC-type phosphate transport system auxiliary subunit
MPQKANVASVDALEAFRACLIVYVSQARSTLEEVSADVLRMRLWLQSEQRMYWEQQLRRRQRALEEAQQTLFSSRISSLRHESAAEQMAVHRAKSAVEEAETKLRTLRRWERDFDTHLQPLVKQMEKLHTVLTNDMVKAIAFLTEAVRALAEYASIRAPDMSFGPSGTTPPPATASDASTPSTGTAGGAP